jgi:hypothetical protein
LIISVINHTNGELGDAEIHHALRAVNRQIACDFEPYWSLDATLRLEGRSAKAPDEKDPRDMRGDAVLYLWNEENADAALGFHEANNRGIPYGFVFTALAKALGESWTVTLSHEALEMIADPEVNLLVQGPHPSQPGKFVFYWYEMCDAVQSERYALDGVQVSNFVLPLYFTGQQEPGGRNDYLGTTSRAGGVLQSFGINPGGYVGYFDPETGQHETVSRPGDRRAARRLAIKQRFSAGRRSIRYQRFAAAATAATQPRAARGAKRRVAAAADQRGERPGFVPCPSGVQVIGVDRSRKP